MGQRSLVLVLAALVAASPLAAAAKLPPIAGGARGLAILRPCATAQLKAAVADDRGATLHRELRITLTNAGRTACAIHGYPAVRLLDELKHPRIVAESFTQTPRMFTIAPGASAAFGLRVATGDGAATYMTAPTLAIIPPGDVVPLFVSIELPVAPTIEVTALHPATP